ncbi:hypothetical protein PSH92_03345 [Pseudomonas beijingensis]|uniref:Uncharacterized protein n=1 Tax=Pseudomonas beijingensis TaxID=2954101 RepID=A0ABY9FEC5_9PSED|nr:hypothetical protein [Pseudomonas sp. FP2034]WLH01921.1 hypothetical protein PSH92_03345 [Pseudomonas sp. FP2034]
MNIERLQAGERLFHSRDATTAAVVGSSLLSFDQRLSPQDREDICLSNLYAQMATRSAYQDGLVGSWFSYYRNTLRYLGWDSARSLRPGQAGEGSMAESISRQLSQAFDERFARPATESIGALERNPKALEVFERASLQHDSAFFQITSCLPKSPGRIEVALYHKQFSLRKAVSTFLFWPIEQVVQTSLEEMAVVTFNTLHYATYREKVLAAVIAETTRNIHALKC